jgi:hypothetical protein
MAARLARRPLTPLRLVSLPALLVAAALGSPLAAAQAAKSEPLHPLAFLAGSCWAGPAPGGKGTDTHCFEWVFDGRFLRDHHVVRGAAGPYEGETLYAWNPEAERIVYTYWASDGGYSTGTVEAREGELLFVDHYVSSEAVLDLQSSWRRSGGDEYGVEVRSREGEGWKPMWTTRMRRVIDAAQRPR